MASVAARLGLPPLPRATLALVLAAMATAAAALTIITPFLPRLDHDYDEGVYWSSLESMAHGHRLFAEVFSSQPPLFLQGMLPLYELLGRGLVAGRVGVFLVALLGVVAAYQAGRVLGGRWVALFAAAALALEPVYLRGSIILQADGPSVSLEVVAVALALRGTVAARRRPLWFALAGLAVAAAAMVKLFAIAAIVPVVLLALLGTQERRARLIDGAAGLAGAVGGVALIALPYVVSGAGSAMLAQAVGFHLTAEQGTTGSIQDHISLILHQYLGVPLAVLALGSLAALRGTRRPQAIALLGWLLASVYLLLRQRPLWEHHVILLTAPICLLAALAVADMAAAEGPRKAGARALSGAAAVALLFLATTYVVDLGMRVPGADGARSLAMARVLVARLGHGATVISDEPFAISLAGDQAPPDVVDTSRVRIHGQALTTARAEAGAASADAVLEATGRLASLPGFNDWLDANFIEVPSPAGSRLWVRRRG